MTDPDLTDPTPRDWALRTTFTAHEGLAPDPGLVTARIGLAIARRRRRARVVQAAAAVGLAMVIGAGVPLLVSTGGPAPSSTGNVGTSPTADPALVEGPLVVPETGLVTIPVEASWLPDDVSTANPTAFADLVGGRRTLRYGGQPAADGVESVEIFTGPRRARTSPVFGDGVTDHAQRTITIHGQPAQEVVMLSDVDGGGRTCTIEWDETPTLTVTTTVAEKTTAAEATCAVGERFAEGLVDQPRALPRTASFGLVPVDYAMAGTGTNGETWCPADAVAHAVIALDGTATDEVGPRCLLLLATPEPPPDGGRPLTVRGHQGWVSQRDSGETVLLVPGWITLIVAADTPDTLRTDATLVRLVGAAVLDRPGW